MFVFSVNLQMHACFECYIICIYMCVGVCLQVEEGERGRECESESETKIVFYIFYLFIFKCSLSILSSHVCLRIVFIFTFCMY